MLAGSGNGGTVYPESADMLTSYRLQEGSPAIDAGISLEAQFGIPGVSADFWGESASQGAGSDVGAGEFEPASSDVDEKQNSSETIPVIRYHPESGILYVAGGGITRIELYSTAGRLVRNYTVHDSPAALPCEDLPHGVYFVRTGTDHNSWPAKLIRVGY